MKYILTTILICLFAGPAMSQTSDSDLKAAWMAEINLVERQFMETLQQSGPAEAFYRFAAPNAVIKRADDALITGPDAIKDYYSQPVYQNAVAEWAPDFIDVSDDGTLAYTYGKYRWVMTDANGNTTEYKGVFHTVWKRMEDGAWKYVWD